MEYTYDPNSPVSKDKQKFTQQALRESERGLILITTSELDHKLERILTLYLEPSRTANDQIFKYGGALGSFSNRIEMCFRLNIIDSSFADGIDSLRKSRNRMAHDLDDSLDNDPHKQHLSNAIENMQKSNLLKALYETSNAVNQKYLSKFASAGRTASLYKSVNSEGRKKLTFVHMAFSILLDEILELLELGAKKKDIFIGLDSYDERYKSVQLLKETLRKDLK